jgi:hypothetical protein
MNYGELTRLQFRSTDVSDNLLKKPYIDTLGEKTWELFWFSSFCLYYNYVSVFTGYVNRIGSKSIEVEA